jgi:hypothetical protein
MFMSSQQNISGYFREDTSQFGGSGAGGFLLSHEQLLSTESPNKYEQLQYKTKEAGTIKSVGGGAAFRNNSQQQSDIKKRTPL